MLITRHHGRLASGLGVSWLEAGQGPAVILLHGFPELAVSWREQLPALATHHRVIAPDLRGYGESDAPVGWRRYRPAALVRDVAELADLVGEPAPHLVGHDWGGAIAWMAASALPGRFASLAVLNCPHPAVMLRALATSPAQLCRSWYMFAFQLPWLPEWIFRRRAREWITQAFRGSAANPRPFDDAALEPYVAQARGGLAGGINYYRAALRTPPGRWRRIEIPTLLAWGVRDAFLGRSLARPDRYRRLVRSLRVAWIDEAAHWVQQEAPAAVNALLLDHFARSVRHAG